MTDAVYIERRDGKIIGYSRHLIVDADGRPLEPQEVADKAAIVAEVETAERTACSDFSNLDIWDRKLKALALVTKPNGMTLAQFKAALKNAYDNLS